MTISKSESDKRIEYASRIVEEVRFQSVEHMRSTYSGNSITISVQCKLCHQHFIYRLLGGLCIECQLEERREQLRRTAVFL